jgi:hypothetical protein
MTTMRAKMKVGAIQKFEGGNEQLSFFGVAAKSYPADGSDEDNSFAKFSPSASLVIMIANPALHGKFAVGDTFYVDFTPTEPA